MRDASGIFKKYFVRREDGRDRAGWPHFHCKLFVLDLTHDPCAIVAIRAYAEACAKSRPKLAADLVEMAEDARKSGRFLA